MRSVTLYKQDRDSKVSALPASQAAQVMSCLKDILGENSMQTPMKVRDLENILDVNYVDKNRDLSSVEPVSPKSGTMLLDRQSMQPLLDALKVGDFELAEALTPKKYRFCGYNELKEDTVMEQYGLSGWADQFAITNVPAGIYPVFVDKFAYNERDKHFTNEVHYRGIFEWFEGTCMNSSWNPSKTPEPNVVIQEPYAYDVARNASRDAGTRHLVYPFKPVATEYKAPGCSPYLHFTIVHSSVPYKAEENPLQLRGRCIPPQTNPSLAEKIQMADAARQQATNANTDKNIGHMDPAR